MERPCLDALPEPDRTDSLQKYLDVFAEHPNLLDFRRIIRAPQDRQLALFAALERAVIVGSPTVSPPKPDDEADQLLCDLLETIDSHPQLKNCGAAYGPHRYLANLQALGVWRRNQPIAQPCARQLFATAFANLSAEPASDLPALAPNYSPASQESAPNGELIDPFSGSQSSTNHSPDSAQTTNGVLVVAITPNQQVTVETAGNAGIIRHQSQTPGEKCCVGWDKASSEAAGPPSLAGIPAATVRRGRPIKLDDFAKGRLLGLMSHGLSFRQAAAQLGVHHQTLLNALKRDEEFAQQVSEARLNAISEPLLTVIQASRTNWRAAAWLAKFLDDRRTKTLETTPEERELKR
jgi:hypothetical protein